MPRLSPAALGKLFAKLGRSMAQRFVVVVNRLLQALHAAAEVHRLALVHQIVHGRVLGAGSAEHALGFALAVRLPDVGDLNDGQHHALGIAERDGGAGL